MKIFEFFGQKGRTEKYATDLGFGEFEEKTREVSKYDRWEATAPDGAKIEYKREYIDAGYDIYTIDYKRNGESINYRDLREMYNIPSGKNKNIADQKTQDEIIQKRRAGLLELAENTSIRSNSNIQKGMSIAQNIKW